MRVEERFLIKIFSGVLSAGLEVWCPDLLSPPDSIYNQVHEIVFTQTFKSVAASFAYRFLEPTPSGVNNPALLTDLFLTFGFSYMRNKVKVESREPGKLVDMKGENNCSRRRLRVS